MANKIPKRVEIREVGPRDGLQNEQFFVPTENKIEWINLLSVTGLEYIETTSFVHPKWIPALADAEQVLSGIKRNDGITYTALVPNIKGFYRAIENDVDEIALFLSSSETHNKSNLNSTIDESLANIKTVAKEARAKNIKMRGYISTVFGCPFEGEVSLEQVGRIANELFDMGIYEVSLGDTIGIANPLQVTNTLEVLLKDFSEEQLALHFHDTYGRALSNIWASLNMGIYKYDSALGGLGGCPYAPGASGNVSTEDLVDFCEQMQIDTNIDKDKLFNASTYIGNVLNKSIDSHVYRAYATK